MANSYYDSVVQIPNGSWIGIKNLRYDFGYKNKVIVADCTNFSYISENVIALKKDNKILVFSTKVIEVGNTETIEKLLEFTAYSPVAYGKIICKRHTYLIDGNCQIKFSERTHIN